MSKLQDENGGVLQVGPSVDPQALRDLEAAWPHLGRPGEAVILQPPPPPGSWERSVQRVIEAAYALTHAADRFWPEQPQHVAPKLDALNAAVVNYWRAMGGDEDAPSDV